MKPKKEAAKPSAKSDKNDNFKVPKRLNPSDYPIIMERNKSMITDYAKEYRKRFPNELNRVATLAMERMQTLVTMASIEEGFEAFADEDFAPERFMQRWNTSDIEGLTAFLKRPDLKAGDIWSYDTLPYLTTNLVQSSSPRSQQIVRTTINHQQILRNTPCPQLIFDFGKTYVGIGYVDLCQLLWGEYQNEGGGTLRFYGYDQAEVTVGRSVLMYEMMKAEEREVSEKTILQVWFSSCWDRETQEQFFSFLDKHVPKINNHLLSKYAPIWKAKKGMTARQAQDAFTKHRRSCDFMPINNLLAVDDQIHFANYLFTGALFMDKNRPIDSLCGNVTMFPGSSEDWIKVKFEDFFNTIDMNTLCQQFGPSSRSVIELILKSTESKLKKLRSFVREGKMLCKLNVKQVATDDSKFAKEVRSLDPYFIDWSNIPDYYSRLDFIELARKCSGPDTLHHFHTMNWVYKVFGASFYDFVDRREVIESIYKKHKKVMEPVNQMLRMTSPDLTRLVRVPKLNLPVNEFSALAVQIHGEKYLKHIMTDKKGKVLNFVKTPFNHYWQIFGDNDTLMICAFSFNDELELGLKYV